MRQFAPAAERNCEPILATLREMLPATGLVLEIAAGTGQHAVYLARHLPSLQWQPTDISAGALESIAAWYEWADLPNLRPPLRLDAADKLWPVPRAEAVFCANLLHISPWGVCEALFVGASRILRVDAPLVIYGPFFSDGVLAAAGNEAFDASLRRRDPAWGVRCLKDVERVAAACGFALKYKAEMPANNLTLAFLRKSQV